MKNILITIAIAVAIIGGVVYVSSNNTNQNSKYDITLSQINENLDEDAILVDVRTIEEFSENHAKNAINIPLDDIQNGTEPEIDKDKIVYLYCRSGNRAGQAKTILEQKGFQHVINIESLEKWIALGGKTETGTTCTSAEKC